jgi:hypothetical protein
MEEGERLLVLLTGGVSSSESCSARSEKSKSSSILRLSLPHEGSLFSTMCKFMLLFGMIVVVVIVSFEK